MRYLKDLWFEAVKALVVECIKAFVSAKKHSPILVVIFGAIFVFGSLNSKGYFGGFDSFGVCLWNDCLIPLAVFCGATFFMWNDCLIPLAVFCGATFFMWFLYSKGYCGGFAVLAVLAVVVLAVGLLPLVGCAYTCTKLGLSNDASNRSSKVGDVTSTNTEHTIPTALPIRTTQSNTLLLQSPTMPELVSFTLHNGKSIDISAEIGSKYKEFGLILLEDKSGKRVENIAYVKFEEAKETNQRILQTWREGAGRTPVTWETLIEVLNELNMSKLAARIESSVDLTRRPDMPEFVTLKLRNGEALNIPAEIGHLSLTFGILLLDDTNGKMTEGLAHGKRLPKDISVDILKEWLKGIGRKPTTWKILVDTLKQIGLAELGNDIETSL